MRILPWKSGESKPGVQVVVAGNSHTTRTVFRGGEEAVTRLSTADLVDGRLGALDLQPELDTVIVSVVPAADPVLQVACPRAGFLLHEDALIAIEYDPPESLGADRLANALAARELYGAPVLVVDCGTATTLTLVDAAGCLAGGAIGPGLTPCLDAVRTHTPLLPGIPVEWPSRAIGRSTIESLQIGLVRGHAGMIRALAAEMAPGVPLVMTGGWSPLLAQRVGAVRHGNLTAWGGRVYWESCIRRNEREIDDGG